MKNIFKFVFARQNTLLGLLLMLAIFPILASAQNGGVYKEQGGLREVVSSGSELAIAGKLAFTPATAYSAVQISTSFATTNSFLVINATGTITSTATPAISTLTATSGQEMIIMGGANPVTFQDNDQLSGSLLELGSATRALGAGDVLKLIYYSGKWYEIAFVNN